MITSAKTIGMTKRYRQLTIVMTAKHTANAQTPRRIVARVPGSRPASCQASTAEKT